MFGNKIHNGVTSLLFLKPTKYLFCARKLVKHYYIFSIYFTHSDCIFRRINFLFLDFNITERILVILFPSYMQSSKKKKKKKEKKKRKKIFNECFFFFSKNVQAPYSIIMMFQIIKYFYTFT